MQMTWCSTGYSMTTSVRDQATHTGDKCNGSYGNLERHQTVARPTAMQPAVTAGTRVAVAALMSSSTSKFGEGCWVGVLSVVGAGVGSELGRGICAVAGTGDSGGVGAAEGIGVGLEVYTSIST